MPRSSLGSSATCPPWPYTMIDVGGGVGGGLQKKPMPEQPTAWLPYVEVDDVKATMAKVFEGRWQGHARLSRGRRDGLDRHLRGSARSGARLVGGSQGRPPAVEPSPAPAKKAAKKAPAKGGSARARAREEGGSAREEGGSAREEGGSAREESSREEGCASTCSVCTREEGRQEGLAASGAARARAHEESPREKALIFPLFRCLGVAWGAAVRRAPPRKAWRRRNPGVGSGVPRPGNRGLRRDSPRILDWGVCPRVGPWTSTCAGAHIAPSCLAMQRSSGVVWAGRRDARAPRRRGATARHRVVDRR